MDSYSYEFSVLVITYNHEAFIEEAIQSILAQKFQGRLQVVIGVDKCKDKTLDICKAYQDKHPDLIELIVHEVNVGMYQNFVDTLKRCNGKYISILEGDDYWTYENKLKDQFDFFEKHSKCILSAGNVDVVDEKSRITAKAKVARSEGGLILSREDLIITNQLTTLTVAFRKSAISWSELDKLRASPHLDWPFYISLNYPPQGFIYKFDKKFGAYRVHSGGVYSMIDEDKRNQNILKTIGAIHSLDLEEGYHEYLKRLFSNFSLRLQQKEVLNQEPYKNLYDPSLIIYDEKNKIKNAFIKRLKAEISFNKINYPGINQWKLDFELIRQTRSSVKSYLNVELMALLPYWIILRQKEKRLKKKWLS